MPSPPVPIAVDSLPATVAAVLVLYDPLLDAGPAVEVALRSLARVVVVDNSTDGHPAMKRWRDVPRVTLLHQRNRGGLAGAYNAALRWLFTEAPRISHVVFIDEDSDASVLPALLEDEAVTRLLADPGTAAVAPAHRDGATGLRARHMVLHRWRWHYLPRETQSLQRVAFVINSMSIWRVDALRRIGSYNEWLGVDHVDTEYCLRARGLGLAVYLHGDHEFAQTIGARRAYRLLGHELQSGGHSPVRRFSIGRNTAWLGRTYLLREPAFAVLCVARFAYEVVGIVIAEPNKLRKILSLSYGAVCGLVGWGGA